MATQSVPMPDRLSITEDVFEKLRHLAEAQKISMSDALTQAINISDYVVRQVEDPGTKLLLKKGKKYEELVLE
jgi:hypothetical protein